jgi:hypothetical protein
VQHGQQAEGQVGHQQRADQPRQQRRAAGHRWVEEAGEGRREHHRPGPCPAADGLASPRKAAVDRLADEGIGHCVEQARAQQHAAQQGQWQAVLHGVVVRQRHIQRQRQEGQRQADRAVGDAVAQAESRGRPRMRLRVRLWVRIRQRGRCTGHHRAAPISAARKAGCEVCVPSHTA